MRKLTAIPVIATGLLLAACSSSVASPPFKAPVADASQVAAAAVNGVNADPQGCEQVVGQLLMFANKLQGAGVLDSIAFLGALEEQLSQDSADVTIPVALAQAEGMLASSLIDATHGYNMNGYEKYVKQIHDICPNTK
jgi:hypothetical protein